MARRSLFLAVLVSALAGLAPRAGAHAELVRSDPADGAALARAPSELRLHFSEAISPRFRVVRLIDGRGRPVAGARVRSAGDDRLVVSLPRLHRGAYEVTWEVLADDDGHITGGTTVFGVATQPPAARTRGEPGAAPEPLEAALRWVDIALFVSLIGALAMAALLTRVDEVAQPAAQGARRRLLAACAAAATAGIVLGLVLLVRQVDRVAGTVGEGTSVGGVLGTRWGALWNARELLLTALLAVTLWLRATAGHAPAAGTPRPGTTPWRIAAAGRAGPAALLVGGLVVALAVVRALTSHAAAGAHPGPAVAVAAAHLLAAGTWIGAVAALGVALAAARGEARTLARACRRPFARAAAGSLAILAVTGLLAAGVQVASVDALLTTDYGRTLITKTGLVAVAAALGMTNALLLARGALPRLLRVEVAAGASVLLAAAVLTASPPAKGPEFAAPRPVSAPELLSRRGDLVITATARPNRAGPNVFTVLAVSSRRPPPAPVERVAIRLAPADGRPPRTVTLNAQTPGHFAGGTELDTQGRWRMTALVERGAHRLAVPFTWTVAPPDTARPVTYSARPLAPLLDRAAALVVLLLATAAAVAAVRRRSRRPRMPRALPIVEPLGKEIP
jgi:copper transport protein